MENTLEDIKQLEDAFKACQKVLVAIGDETRQHLLMIMLQGECSGQRVVDIAKRTHLSRPAVSHHMQILKDAGIVKARKEGTLIYYYLGPNKEGLGKLIALCEDINRVMQFGPDRRRE